MRIPGFLHRVLRSPQGPSLSTGRFTTSSSGEFGPMRRCTVVPVTWIQSMWAQTLLVGVTGVVVGQSTAWVIRRHVPSWQPSGLSWLVGVGWGVVPATGAGGSALLLTWWCSCLASVDIGSRRLPNLLTAVGAVAVLGYGVLVGTLADVVIGGGALFGVYLAVHLILPKSFGGGDVKLAFALGGVAASVGIDAWVLAALLAPLLTGVLGILMTVGRTSRTSVPHGPSMCAATLLALAAAAT